jgi:hypothetical protein
MDKITVAKMGTDNFKNLFKEGKDRKGFVTKLTEGLPCLLSLFAFNFSDGCG